MCCVGDIILVDNFKVGDQTVGKHSFIVISDQSGQIQGLGIDNLNYDLICNVMSSFKNEEQKEKKLSYPGNFPISNLDSNVINGNNKEGFIKAEQFYFFNKSSTKFKVIGSLNEDVFNDLLTFIQQLNIPIEQILDNLT